MALAASLAMCGMVGALLYSKIRKGQVPVPDQWIMPSYSSPHYRNIETKKPGYNDWKDFGKSSCTPTMVQTAKITGMKLPPIINTMRGVGLEDIKDSEYNFKTPCGRSILECDCNARNKTAVTPTMLRGDIKR